MTESSEALQSPTLQSDNADLTIRSISQIVDQIATTLQAGDDLDRKAYESLYSAFYRHKKTLELAQEPYDKEMLVLQEARLNDLNQQFRLIEKKRAEALAAQQLANGTKAEQLLDELEQLLSSQEEFKIIYDRFHQIREEWGQVGTLTTQDESRLGKRYESLRDAFYELKNINTELRDYDFRKNLEQKQALLEELRQLEADPDILSAHNKLNAFVSRWRNIGPVAPERRSEINDTYRELRSSIHKRHQTYHDELKSAQEEGNKRKEAIIQTLQAYNEQLPKTYSEWTTKTEEIKKLQEEFRSLSKGGKGASELFLRFRAECDKFFAARQLFREARKADHAEGVAKRKELIAAAIETAKGEHFIKTAEALKQLQEAWKQLPGIRKEEGDRLWQEFRKPFEEFFKRRREHERRQNSQEREHAEQKRAIIAELKAITELAELPERLKDKLTAYKEEWKKIGRASAKINDELWAEYCALNDALYARLRELTSSRRGAQIQARIEKLTEQPSGVKHELQFLQRKAERLRSELRNYDNNLNFLSPASNSKENPLLVEIERKRAKLAQDLARVEEEIKLLRSAHETND